MGKKHKKRNSGNVTTSVDKIVSSDDHQSYCPSNRNRIEERRLFISFHDETFYDIQLPKKYVMENDQIDRITASGSQCYCSTERGKMIRFELTKDRPKVETMPTSSDFTMDKTRVKFLLAGYYHVIVIKESDKIYVHVLSGNFQYGSLESPQSRNAKGVEPFSLISTKHFITEGKTITHAACGTYSTIVVLNHKYIYIAGKLDEDQFTNYTHVTIEENEDYPIIKSISAGYGHIIVQTMNGEIYGMGQNSYGQTLSLKSSDRLMKITGLVDLVNITAIRLSHLTCLTTKDTFKINGYVGGDLDGFKRIHSDQYVYYTKPVDDLKVYGGFTSIITYSERRKELMACGSTVNAPKTPYDILAKLKTQFASNLDIASYLDCNRHTVIDVACGSNLIAVLMGSTITMDSFLVNNLLKMKKYAVHELDHSSETVPFHDLTIYIK